MTRMYLEGVSDSRIGVAASPPGVGESGPVPVAISPTAGLRAVLDALADAVATLRFDLAGPGQAGDRRLRDRVERTIRDYLDPRLARRDLPVVVALVGSTGSGKSTILNSLAGAEISRAGVLRPTTGRPVVWRHRSAATHPAVEDLEVDTHLDDHPLLRGLVLIDTPDIDSQVSGHRVMAERIVSLADVAVFVTTPQRYADSVPWSVLEDVRRRGKPVVVVLNRASRRSRGAAIDLARLLDRAHIHPEGGIHELQEQRLRGEERLLPRSALRVLRATLEGIAGQRAEVIGRAVTGGLSDVLDGSRRLLSSLERQTAAGVELVEVVAKEHEAQLEHLSTQLQQGDLVRREVLDRWRRLLGVSDLAAGLGAGWSRVRHRLARPGPALRQEAREELTRLIRARLRAARRGVESAWVLHPGSEALLPLPERVVSSDEITAAVEAWMAGLVELVRDPGRARHRAAKALSWGINAGATTLLVATFAHSGGLTGAELGIAAGAAAAQHTALEHLLGTAAAGRIVRTARARLVATIEELLRRQADAFVARVGRVVDPPDRTVDLARAIAAVEREIG